MPKDVMPWLTFFDTGYIKHRDNPFRGIDSECNSISFLLDSNTAASTVNYINANSEIGNKVLLVRLHDYIKIPPGEKAHWDRYRIPVKFE
jgi:hypothetical protein